MVGREVNNEYGGILREAVMSTLKKIFLRFLLGTEDNEEKLRIIGVQAEIRKRHLLNTMSEVLPLEPTCRLMNVRVDGW
jgi:hypothetical protein